MESFVLAPSSVLKDRYRLQRIIQQDGPVVEYLAEDVANGARYRVRQVHVVYTDPATSRRHRQNFRDTAPQLIGLHHRALTAVVDCFDQGPDFFTVSAWVDGPSLATVAVPVPTEVALRWMVDVLDAMEIVAAHSDRIGLPELTPQTIRVRDNGTIVIGCLRCLDDGTPASAHPSPFHSGDRVRSFRSDVYTLGALIWWLLTGQVPPSAAERRRGERALTLPSHLPPVLGRGLLRMMSIEPRRRPGTTAHVRQVVLQSGLPAQANPRRARARAVNWPVLAGTVSAAVLLLASPLIRGEVRHVQDVHHQRTVRDLLNGARLEFNHDCYQAAATDFARVARGTDGVLSPDDALHLADAERRLWHPTAARHTLDSLMHGDGAAYWIEMARIEQDLGQAPASSLQHAEDAVEAETGADRAWHTGEIALLRHQWLEAEKALRDAIGEQTTLVAAEVELGEALRHEGDYDEARQVLELAARHDAEAVSAQVELGRTALDAGQFSAAIDAFRAALQKGPQAADAWHGLAQAELAQGQVEDALSATWRAVRYNRDDAAAQVDLGHLLTETRRPALAVRWWSAAQRTLQEVPRLDVEARLWLDRGMPAQAVETLKLGDPSDPEEMALLALAQARSHQPGPVSAELESLKPRGAWGQYQTGRVYQQMGRFDLAEAAFEAGARQEPKEAAYELALGECLVAAGAYEPGTRHLARVCVDAPTSSEALRWLARAEQHLSHLEMSALHLQEICALDDRVEAWAEAGQRWMASHRWDKAVGCYLLGSYHHPHEPRFKFWLAECFVVLGRPGQAAYDFRSFLHAVPSGAMADEARVRLHALHPGVSVHPRLRVASVGRSHRPPILRSP